LGGSIVFEHGYSAFNARRLSRMDAFTFATRTNARRKAGGGALTFNVVMYGDRADLDRRAAAGDRRSRRLMQTLHEMYEAIAARARRAPIQCSTCATPICGVAWAAVIAAPEMSIDPTPALSLAICATCGPTLRDVQRLATPVLQRAFPGCYAVLPGVGGRA
jgi:hypothetical protein